MQPDSKKVAGLKFKVFTEDESRSTRTGAVVKAAMFRKYVVSCGCDTVAFSLDAAETH